MSQITFAKVGGPPHDWQGLRIFDRSSGAEIESVIEVDTVERYLIRHKLDDAGKPMLSAAGDAIEVERVSGDFEIRRP